MKKIQKYINVLLALVVAAPFGACGDGAGNGSVDVWGAYSEAKVMKDPAYNKNHYVLEAKAEVYAAHGETESAQIIFTTGNKGVKNYSVKLSDLTDKDGKTYSKENVSVYFQHYVFVEKKSNNDDYNAEYYPTGYTPDALIPQAYSIAAGENFVDANSNQGITFDFAVPSQTEETDYTGTYTGEFTLYIDGKAFDIPVSLTVWDYDITETNGMNLWDIVENLDATGEMDGSGKNYQVIYDALLNYKINAYHFPNETDIEEWVNHLETYFSHPAFGGVFLPDIGGKREQTTAYFTAITELCVKNGVDYFEKIRYYHQSVDEPQIGSNAKDKQENCVKIINATNDIHADFCKSIESIQGFTALDEELKEAIKTSILNMPQIVTSYYALTESMEEVVGTYCPTIDHYATTQERKYYEKTRIEHNSEKWVYTCNQPSYPYPTYFVDDFLLGGRILKWMQKDYGISGYLNWSVNHYSGWYNNGVNGYTSIDPYTNPLRHDPDNTVFGNGDGYLFYPMAKYAEYGANQPIPSLRLLTVRDGQEDYDTLCKLENAYASAENIYGVENAIENLSDSLETYYGKLFNNAIANNDEANFDEIRKAIGNMTEAACGDTKTLVMQTLTGNDTTANLSVYSLADEVYVNGVRLTETNDCFRYVVRLQDTAQKLSVKYVKDGVAKTFSYYLPAKTYRLDVSSLNFANVKKTDGSKVLAENGGISLVAASYEIKIAAEKKKAGAEITLPIAIDYANTDKFSFTIENTCEQSIEIELYLIKTVGAGRATRVMDEIVIFPYETYCYEFDELYKIATQLSDANGLYLKFKGVDLRGNLLPEQTLILSDFKYSKVK